MKTVYLHVGKHKTGTTSIQRYMDNHAAWFADKGFHIVRNLMIEDHELKAARGANCFTLAHILLRPELVTPVRHGGVLPVWSVEVQQQFAAKTNLFLHRIEADRLVASAEAFSFLRTPHERKLLDAMFQGFDLRPIIFVRDKHTWLESWRRQIEPIRQSFPSPPYTGTIFDLSPSSWLVDDVRIKAFFGPQSTLLNYDEQLDEADSSLPGFLRAIGLEPAGAPAWDQYWFNRSYQKS